MFNRSKVTYYYNTETCTYEKAGFSVSSVLKKAFLFGLFTLAVCSASFLFYQDYLSKFKESGLIAAKSKLYGDVILQNEALETYHSRLDDMLLRVNQIYIPILKSEKISPAVWEGGRGGTKKYRKHNEDPFIECGVNIAEGDHRVKLLKQRFHELEILHNKLSLRLKNMPSIVPVSGRFISGFGHRKHPVNGGFHFHTGLDFKCSRGTPVYASGDGVVKYANRKNNGYGIFIDVDHENGYETKYAHLSKLNVKKGQNVKRGDIIGYSGNTGMSTGPHLHYEIKYLGQKIDPLDFFYTDLSPTQFLDLKLQASMD